MQYGVLAPILPRCLEPSHSVTAPSFSFHDGWELKISFWGTLPCVFPGYTVHLQPGQVLLIPPGVQHGAQQFVLETDGRWLSMTFALGQSCLLRKVDGSDRQLALHHMGPEQLAELHCWLGCSPESFLEELSLQVRHHRPHGAYLAGRLALFLASQGETLVRRPVTTMPPGEPALVAAVTALLRVNLSSPDLCLAAVADDLGYSPNHLNTLFRRLSGRTIHQALMDLRLGRAKAMLRRQGWQVQDIARLCGWRNQQYFATVFKRHTGMTPREFRRSIDAGSAA